MYADLFDNENKEGYLLVRSINANVKTESRHVIVYKIADERIGARSLQSECDVDFVAWANRCVSVIPVKIQIVVVGSGNVVSS